MCESCCQSDGPNIRAIVVARVMVQICVIVVARVMVQICEELLTE